MKILSEKKAAFVEFYERKSVETVLQKKPIKYGKAELDIKPFMPIRGCDKINMFDLKGCSLPDIFTDELVKKQLESLLAPLPEYGPELAALIKVGTRVVRGRDWQSHWNYDGGPGGQGTVTRIDGGDERERTVKIKWDRGRELPGFPMGKDSEYAVKLAQ